MAKILTSRLEKGLRHIVGSHQSYGFKGRSITNNVHIMQIVREVAETENRPVAVLQVDLSKAFDRVSHGFLFALSDKCGIGETLGRFVRICYRDISTSPLINGIQSKAIPVNSSVRQGCPLSPLLFALYLEPLCHHLQADPRIQGFDYFSQPLKVLAFADGVALIARSKSGVSCALKHVKDFCSVSGARINLSKSSGTWLGTWNDTSEKFLNFAWTSSLTK